MLTISVYFGLFLFIKAKEYIIKVNVLFECRISLDVPNRQTLSTLRFINHCQPRSSHRTCPTLSYTYRTTTTTTIAFGSKSTENPFPAHVLLSNNSVGDDDVDDDDRSTNHHHHHHSAYNI